MATTKIISGERPGRPNHSDFTESLWVLTQRCWSHEPQDRPDIREIIGVLKELSVLVLHLNDKRLTHHRRRPHDVSKPLPALPGESPTTPKDHSTTVSPESSAGNVTSETSNGDAEALKDPLVFGASFEQRSFTDAYHKSTKTSPMPPGESLTLLKTPSTTNDHTSGTSAIETSTPALSRVPTKRLPREEILNEVLDLTDQVASTALFGPVGVGKSFVARTLLDHERTQAKFGTNRHLMRCDDLTSSLDGFLERLSDVINTDRATNTVQL